jgi:Flp pilus assembly protein TadG
MSCEFAPTPQTPGLVTMPRQTFGRDISGVAAVEFAFVLPIMVLILGLCVIMGEALAIGQKVTSTARTIVDIVSRNSQLSTADMNTILNASAYTMTPYDSSNLAMVVAEIQTDGSGNGTVTWSTAAFNGTALKKGASFTLPAAMAVANATYIYGQVSYSYTPLVVGFSVPQPIALSDVAFFSPRVSPTVNYPYPN